MSHAKLSTARPATPLALAVLAALAAAAPAAAQESSGSVLDEIVVTAQKREQNVQDVPIAVAVVSGDKVESLGGFNAEALKTLVPSLNIRKTNTSLNQALFLRGVGTINFAIAAQPSVATVLDGVVLASAGEAFGDLYDVERIEVLRGPQGTLFGKNASAGVVNIVSKRPGKEFGGYVDLGWYEDDEKRVKASIDTPISETLRGRTTVTWGEFDGYIDNVTSTPAGGKLNGYDRKGVRTLWVAEPSDAVTLTFIGDWRESDDNCCVEVIGALPANAALRSILSGVNYQGVDTREVKQDLQMRSTEEAWGASLQADIDLAGGRTLTSITAYRTWDAVEYREGDWHDRPASYVGNAFAQLHDFGPQETKTLSQELRIASPGGEFIDYVAGIYYSKTEAERFFQRNVINCTASTLPADSTGGIPCAPGSSTIINTFSNATFGADFDNLAVFADGTVNFTDRVRGIVGLRWTQDDLTYFHDRVPTPFAGQPGIRTDTTGFRGGDKSDNLSGRVGLQFDLTDDVMLYTTYAKGYKGPAFNVFFNMTANNRQVLDAETVDSAELGVKSTIFGGKVLLNAATFYAKYDDFQANNFTVLNGVTITTLTNAGKVTTGGFELDFLARPSEALTVSGGLAYTDARVDEFFTPAGSTPTVRAGSALPLAPKWKGSLGAEYRFSGGSWDFIPSLQYSFQSESWSDLNELATVRIGASDIIDLQLSWASQDDRYRVSVIGRNLTDESEAALKTTGGPGGAIRLQIPRDASMYWGLQFRASFGGN